MEKPTVLHNQMEEDLTEYIDTLLRKEEAVDLEFKIAKDGFPNSLWDTYSAFANTDGFTLAGMLMFGKTEVDKIIKGWREANWQQPCVEELRQPDKVELTLPMASLLPDDSNAKKTV